MDGTIDIDGSVVKVDVAEDKRNDRGGGFDRRNRQGGCSGSGSGFRGRDGARDGGRDGGRSGYSADTYGGSSERHNF